MKEFKGLGDLLSTSNDPKGSAIESKGISFINVDFKSCTLRGINRNGFIVFEPIDTITEDAEFEIEEPKQIENK